MASAPRAIKLHRAENVLELQWTDGTSTRLPARLLRCECRCAGCVDEITGVRTLDVDAVDEAIQIDGAQLAGNYAIKLAFSDGHDAGLYTWKHLHELADSKTEHPPR